jgi:uncharacterized protein YeaO (DUF488 family)
MIKLKRAYDPATRDDGTRFLVERLWPRGVKKSRLTVEGWMHAHRAAWQPLLAAARRGRVTFVYAAHDVARNGAVALKTFLDRRL